MNQPTSKAQKRVLDALRDLHKRHGRAISLTEIAKEIGKSPSTIYVHLLKLESLELVDRRTKGCFPVVPEIDDFQRGWEAAVRYMKGESK